MSAGCLCSSVGNAVLCLIWLTGEQKGTGFSLRVLKFVLRFYGPVNLMGSCLARSVYLTTRLLGRLSPLSG